MVVVVFSGILFSAATTNDQKVWLTFPRIKSRDMSKMYTVVVVETCETQRTNDQASVSHYTTTTTTTKAAALGSVVTGRDRWSVHNIISTTICTNYR